MTLVLIQQHIIKKDVVDTLSTVAIWRCLINRGIKPWKEKMWCIPTLNEEYITRMENILDLYEKPYDPKEPVICLDEKSIQLLADIREPQLAVPGTIRKQDYEYKRNGTRNIFVSVEPKGGRRRVKVTRKRKKCDFTYALKHLIINRYTEATTIHVVMDNLNTHFKKSLVDTLGEKEANRLWGRITPHYTPKHASWLNMAEIEIGILTRQVLKKRLKNESILKEETAIWQRQRNRQRKIINWRYTKQDARKALKYDPTELS